jgi:Ca-activated chloride channel family protein
MAGVVEHFQEDIVKAFVVAGLVVVATSVGWAQSERSLIREGNSKYERQSYTDAEINYRKAIEKNRDIPQGSYNLGDALYKQERYNEAVEQFSGALAQAKDPATKAKAYHNLGNALLQAKKLPESIEAYKEALKLNPKDFDTKYNLAYAQALIQQQQQQQQQNQKNQKDQRKDDQKKQQNDQQQNDQQKNDQQKQDQQQNNQQQTQQDKTQQKQGQKPQQLSQQDAERILEALRNEERDVKKKLQKKVPARVRVEKDW